ncbi:hypothetical protein AMTR_s05571p00001370 [Amborella trichopoda]|uniref:Uncharacterized protein n=1 Tax=Amborella trichopoda TaxID=13333 RepID=U5CZ98_AMBTC|nr:hypothetical protein AMTR_s05571p00001370 [Amborella trichopoda]
MELDPGERQQAGPSTQNPIPTNAPEQDFQVPLEGAERLTFYENAIHDLILELRDEEKIPLPDEPYRVQRIIEVLVEKEEEGFDGIHLLYEEMQKNRLMSRGYLHFNVKFALDLEVEGEDVTEEDFRIGFGEDSYDPTDSLFS